MEITTKLERLREYALTAKTAIYNEDAMTAIELAGQTACKVNECIDAINTICDIVDEISEEIGLIARTYDAANENLII